MRICLGTRCLLLQRNVSAVILPDEAFYRPPPLSANNWWWWAVTMMACTAVLLLFSDWMRLRHAKEVLQAEARRAIEELQMLRTHANAREERMYDLLRESGAREAQLLVTLQERVEVSSADDRPHLTSSAWLNPLTKLLPQHKPGSRPKARQMSLAQIDSDQLSNMTAESPGASLLASRMGSVRGSQAGSRAGSMHGGDYAGLPGSMPSVLEDRARFASPSEAAHSAQSGSPDDIIARCGLETFRRSNIDLMEDLPSPDPEIQGDGEDALFMSPRAVAL